MLILLPLVIFLLSSELHHALSRALTYRLYTVPSIYLTDFDGDGYGLMDHPRDHALFDAALHPYAVEIPGNGIDENGVGGDLTTVEWSGSRPPWDDSKLTRMNVLLVVLESARFNLLDATVGGEPVMPQLRSIGGSKLHLYSHTAFSTASVVAILNGTVSPRDKKGRSLIDRFKAREYRTGVFSGQHEGFGGKADKTSMREADIFRDASTEPVEKRMYSPLTPASLKMPAPVMNARFAKWLDASDPARPFFAYLNWQETHFPYFFRGASKALVNDPIPRGQINVKNRDWLVHTYMNAGRALDDAFGGIIQILKDRGLLDDTVMLVLGDHGEELFDNGYLGHGINLSLEQNATIGKLINSAWKPPSRPLGISEVGTILHNALLRDPSDGDMALPENVVCTVGPMHAPVQIGLVDASGLLRYDFRKDLWGFQRSPGSTFESVEPDFGLIHRWESLVIEQLAH